MTTLKQTMIGVVCGLAIFSACEPAGKKMASLEAEIKGLTDSVVYISRASGDSAITDTVHVTAGKFVWTGQLPDPQKMFIGTSRRYMEIFMENSAVKVTGTIDSLYYSKVTGSATHDEYEAFNNSLKDLDDQQYPLYPQLHEAKDDAVKADLERRIDSFRLAKRERMKAYIRSNPASMVSLSLVDDMAMLGEWAPLDSLYRVLDPNVQQTTMGKRLNKRLEVLKRSAMGQPVKDFTQTDVNGKPVKISDFKGKYLFIDFWASWCGPCRAENPNVLKAYNTFKDKQFEVLGISLDDNEEKWKKAIEEDGMPWTQLSDLKGFKNEIAAYYGINAIPYSFLLDPDGKIIAKGLRGTELHTRLSEILQ